MGSRFLHLAWKTICLTTSASGTCHWSSWTLGQKHRAALRHERIGFITGPLHLRSAVARRDAFEASMREIGLLARPEYVVEGNHRLDGGREALPTLSRLSKPPTALICSNDMTAI